VLTQPQTGSAAAILSCRRCAAPLRPGSGQLYRITVEAVADPFPPRLSIDDADLRTQIEQLMARLEDVPEQEALNQVFRRLTFYLCLPCYQHWIERPTG
jgi:hypothetical protein